MYTLNNKYKFEEKTIRKILEITPFIKVIRARQSYNSQQKFWQVLFYLNVTNYFSFEFKLRKKFHHVRCHHYLGANICGLCIYRVILEDRFRPNKI